MDDSVFRSAQTAKYKHPLGLVHSGSKQNHSKDSGLGPQQMASDPCPHSRPK